MSGLEAATSERSQTLRDSVRVQKLCNFPTYGIKLAINLETQCILPRYLRERQLEELPYQPGLKEKL